MYGDVLSYPSEDARLVTRAKLGRGGALARIRAPFCFTPFDAHSLRLLSMGIAFKLWGFIRLGIGGSE